MASFRCCDARARPYRTQVRFARLGAALCGRQRGDASSGRFPPRAPAGRRRTVQRWFASCRGAAPPVAGPDRGLAGRMPPDRTGKCRTRSCRRTRSCTVSASCCTATPVASRRVLPARYSSRCRRRQRRRTEAVPPALICVLPRNAAAEQVFDINLPGLEVRTDQLVSFQACSSTRHGSCRAGDVLSGDVDAFHRCRP